MAVPTSLFTDCFTRKVDKSELGREIKKNVRNIMPDYATQPPPYSIPVLMAVGCCISYAGRRMLPMQTCWDGTVPFSGQSTECVVCCLMGTNMTQPKITNTSVVRLVRCQVSINCDSRKCTSPQRSASILFK